MNLPMAISSYSYFRLVILLTSTYVHLSSAQVQGSTVAHERVRRSSTCPKNETVFGNRRNSLTCFYDHACFELFLDCCSDYTEKCGEQKSKGTKWPPSLWKCVDNVESFQPFYPCSVDGPSGVWMIHKCPADTTFDSDTLKTKCENVSSKFSYPAEDFIPVVGIDSITYRNKYCALCNRVENFTSWDIGGEAFVVPPKHLDLDSALKFIERNGGFQTRRISPKDTQPRRYCYDKNYVDNCSKSKDPKSYEACVEGPIEVVTNSNYLYFKNAECANCSGYPNLDKWKASHEFCIPMFSDTFSVVFKLRNTDGKQETTRVVGKTCPRRMVYDTTLGFCRKGSSISSSNKLTNEFLVSLWLKNPTDTIKINFTREYDLKSALSSAISSQFSLLLNQISNMVFHEQFAFIDSYFVATFRLTLTPFQTLIMANQHKSNLNITDENTAFLGLLNFTRNFTLVSKKYDFSVVNVVSKQLSCYGERKFQSHDYKFDRKSGSFLLNKTGEKLLLKDYSLVEENGGKITLCRNLVLSDCEEGSYVPLRPDEYVILPNLSIYHKATNGTFKFGEYLMSESYDSRNSVISNTTGISRNTTIAICLPFNNSFETTETKYTKFTSSFALQILTMICFSVSTICHISLLVTYGLFQELRNVPGLNLMNLCLSMCLSQVVWLIGTDHFKGTIICEVLAILEHYLLQASFLAMSAISHHTSHVFSQPFIGRFANTSRPRFIKYSVFVWLTPAAFVAICVVLDKTELFIVDYGTNCWMGTAYSKLYLFLLPLAIQLLFNIYKFMQTAVGLSRHDRERQALQIKKGKQNLLICLKLATLVGFPWLFAFLGVLFPDVQAFEYFFVVSVCLQGMYIGLAFLFNKKTLRLYKDRWNIRSRGNTTSFPGNTSPDNVEENFEMKAR